MAGKSGGYIDTRGDWSQRKQRESVDFTDQHGREYHGNIETKTGGIVGELEPKFSAPLMPKPQYIERVARRPYDVFINYKRWKADIREARSDWEKDGRQLSRKMHGDAYKPGASFSADILEIIGEPPEAIEPVLAAEQGNKWVLGLTKRVDLRLVDFFEPELLDPSLRRRNEPDFSDPDEDEDVDEVTDGRGRTALQETAGRVPVVRNRPDSRAASRATGSGKDKPRGVDKPIPSGVRQRYPKGHPKGGTFVPQAKTA